MQDITQSAIQAALSHDWETAIHLNETIIEEKKNDIDALSRLAYAYTQTGSIEQARKLYRKILSIDRYNYIAIKNLDKINALPKNTKITGSTKVGTLSPTLFIEEPGKTKSVTLTNIAPASVLSKLVIGQQMILNPKKHSIEVRDEDKIYLGALPDDIAFRLLKFLKAGNTYTVYIKNVQKNSLSVFIREAKRGKKFSNQPTFTPLNHDFATSTPKELKKSMRWNQEETEENAEEPTPAATAAKEDQDEFEE